MNSGSTSITARGVPFTTACMTVPEVCEHLSIGRTKFYEILAADGFDTLKIGKKRLVTVASVNRFVLQQVLAEKDRAGATFSYHDSRN